MPNEVLKHALNYIARGWSIIPTKGKEAAIPWEVYQKRRPTRSEILRWFSKPNTGLAVVTGRISNVAVVDADGEEGIKTISQLHLTSPCSVITSHGKHLYYKFPSSVVVRNTVKSLPGVDTRGEGGYVVAPPSLHPSGHVYNWEAGLTQPTIELPEFPTSIFAQKEKQFNASGWIAQTLKAAEKQRRPNLLKIIGRLRYDKWTYDDALEFLKPHCERLELPIPELERLLEYSYSRPSLETEQKKQEQDETSIQNLHEFFEEEQKVEWICNPFFAKSSFGFVAGLPETMKTWLLIDLALEASKPGGGKWLGQFPIAESKVLYIDQERFKGETQRRFKALMNDKGLTPNDLSERLTIRCGTKTRLNMERSFSAFRSVVSELRPDLILIDSFSTFHTLSENARDEIQRVFEAVKQLREEFGCSVVFIEHENKGVFAAQKEGDEPPSALRMVGSVGKTAAAEFVLTVRRLTPTTSMVYHTKSTLAKTVDPFSVDIADTDKGVKVSATV